MTISIDTISTERIKPSSPTPNHLRIFTLCLLDHLIPAAYSPIVLFYPNRDFATTALEALERVDALKGSLPSVLTRFFPLAGAIRDDGSIGCDDQGALFVTAKVVGCDLSEFLASPDLKVLEKFLPCGLHGEDKGESDARVANIQATVFSCGGIAIGLCISHRILDGAALSTFLKAWADTAAGNSFVFPDFSAPSLFPVDGSWLKDSSMEMWRSLFKKGAFVTKRFVFDGSAIAILRDRATGEDGNAVSPTRIATVSGFIWKHAMQASEKASGLKKPSMATHVVNLRERAAPNFPRQSLGNLIWIASARSGPQGSDLELPTLANGIKESIARIDGEYVQKLQGDLGKEMIQEYLRGIGEFARSGGGYLGFTSWCKLGFYDVDFGWGTPVWVSSIDSSGPFFMNLVVLTDTRVGNGMEAWITLDEQHMSALEANHYFRSFASLNPSPL